VRQIFTTVNTLSGQYASLSVTVATQGASIVTNAAAITTLDTNVGTLTTTVSTQGASIAANAAAISTTTADLASLSTVVTAGSPNLVGALETWAASPYSSVGLNPAWGTVLSSAGGFSGSEQLIGQSPIEPAVAGQTYTFAADFHCAATSGSAISADIMWLDSMGAPVSGSPYSTRVYANPGTVFSNSRPRSTFSATVVAPAGAVSMRARALLYIAPGGSVTYAAVRRFKVERGTFATLFSNEASVRQTFQALNTLDGSYASLASTVSVHGVAITATATATATAIATTDGNVTTLFARYGVELDVNGLGSGFILNNNGSRSDAVWKVDRFRIASPGSPELQPFEVVSGVLFARAAVIRDLSVDTIKIAGNAITKRSFAAMLGGANAGTNSWLTVCTRVVTLPYAADVILQASMQQSYSSSVKTWTARFNVNNGTIVQARGGAGAYTDVPSINGMISLPAGTHTIDLEWFGLDSTISLTAANLIVDPAMK
ncbi:phage tail tip fiber protein, partial [Sphingomonas montanisoli]|uniref:phage tail tip fiber protein n=1 Tax=Sphingomonas montanisoli TaxID=2606412 RepID=UPI0015E16A7C